MKAGTFDELVDARTKELVQRDIRQCKVDVYNAVAPLLLLPRTSRVDGYRFDNDVRRVLTVLASDNHTVDWPARLWADRRQQVATEIIGTLDAVQKAMLAASRPVDPNADTPAIEPTAQP